MKYLKAFLFVVIILFSDCRTHKPKIKVVSTVDTLLLKREVLTTNTVPIPIPIKRDTTIIIKENTVIQKETAFDTSLINSYLEKYYTFRFEEYERIIENYRHVLNQKRKTELQRDVLIKKLDTTTMQKNKALQEIKKTKEIIYDWPLYMLGILFFFILTLLMYQFILNRKLKRKITYKREHHGDSV